MQGSIAWALSAILWGENTIKDGRIEQSAFHDYRLLKLAEMPKIEVIIAPTGGFWGGVGEPTICVVAPAIMNAIAAARGGKPVRMLPLKHEGLRLV